MSKKIAAVTGANRGIGYATVRELCRRGIDVVYLTARDEERGIKAVEELKQEGFNSVFYQLDVTDANGVKAFAEHLKSKHGGLDILVNNAGVTDDVPFRTYPIYEDAKKVIEINYRSCLLFEKYVFPILRDNARVVNVSSACGHIANLKNPLWVERLRREDIELQDIESFISWFLDSVKNGTINMDEFVETEVLAYRISKIAICALTKIQQRKVGRGIVVNSLHPGFVQTEMALGFGTSTLEDAGKATTCLALDIDETAKGKFFWYDKTERDWSDPNPPLFWSINELRRLLDASACQT